MQIIKEKLEIEDTLKKKVKNILMFLNIKAKLERGNLINIPKTNIVYIEPHKLVINNITYLFFNECDEYKLEFRTKSNLFNKVENEIKKLHDYDVAEISCYEIVNASPEFYKWIDENVSK